MLKSCVKKELHSALIRALDKLVSELRAAENSGQARMTFTEMEDRIIVLERMVEEETAQRQYYEKLTDGGGEAALKDLQYEHDFLKSKVADEEEKVSAVNLERDSALAQVTEFRLRTDLCRSI